MNRGIIKKIVAVGISFTMTFGMAVTSFATDPNDNTNSPVEGKGTTVEHVEKKVINITWPVTANNDYFSFVMDAEGLIEEAAKYKGAAATLPASGDTHVYFETDTTGTFENTSRAFEVINNSSHKVEISATATASLDSGTMVELVDTAAEATGADEEGAPKLYLGIIVGNDEQAVTTEGATSKEEAAGAPANFELVSEADGSFSYAQVASPDTSLWTKVPIKLTGAVTKVKNVGDVKAPKVTVTWKYTDPDAAVAAASSDCSGTDIYVKLVADANADMSKITSVKVNGTLVTVNSTNIGITGSGKVQIKGVATTAGTYSVEITYDGITYTASVTKS